MRLPFESQATAQLATHTMVGRVLLQVQTLSQLQSFLLVARVGKSHTAIQAHHRAVVQSQQGVVQGQNFGPVGLFGSA